MTCVPERTSLFPFPPNQLTANNHSLEALSSYIQSQRDLLSRTQSEIERLHALRKDVKKEGDLTVDGVVQKVHSFLGFYGVTLDRRVGSSVRVFLDCMRRLG